MQEAIAEEKRNALDRAAEIAKSDPLGGAAVAVMGEKAKDAESTMDSGFWAKMRAQAQVPVGPQRNIRDGVELAELCFQKYGRYHDMAMLRNSGQVAFNIYGPSLGLRSFSYTEDQYLQKLDTVVAILRDFDQAWFVKQFLQEPIMPRAGLPSTPRYDTAVTLRLNTSPTWKLVEPTLVDEWFERSAN